jgi:hypothetical protein
LTRLRLGLETLQSVVSGRTTRRTRATNDEDERGQEQARGGGTETRLHQRIQSECGMGTTGVHQRVLTLRQYRTLAKWCQWWWLRNLIGIQRPGLSSHAKIR